MTTDPDEITPCQVCIDGEVNEPALDWCHVCHRKLCDDCIAATNNEHGLRFCEECHEKEMAAQLVNAGPDLLAACRAMLDVFRSHGPAVIGLGGITEFRKARRDMRLAVLLAIGEEPEEDDE